MRQAARWIEDDKHRASAQPSGHLSFRRFLLRYPIFLLAFGPPIFRGSTAGVDISKAHADVWSFIQVGWIGLITLRATVRLATQHVINIPKRVRTILRFSFFLGLVLTISTAYSPGRLLSLEFSILYFMTFICVVEFVVDAYWNPPDWIQCLFHLRRIMLILLALVLVVLPIAPEAVMAVVPGFGVRLIGGTIAPMAVLGAVIAIISLYNFLYVLEPRLRAIAWFLVGVISTLLMQTRGVTLSLGIVLALLILGWGRRARRSASLSIAVLSASLLLSALVIGAVGGGRVWNIVNRGQDTANLENASGRTEIWKFVVNYALAHPQGMGYQAGFRTLFMQHFDINYDLDVSHIGNAHNAYVQYLADGGWLAFLFYLVILGKVLSLALRFMRRRSQLPSAGYMPAHHVIRCALLIFAYFLLIAMESADFVVPLQECFYAQNLIIAIILGASTTELIARRALRQGEQTVRAIG